MTSGWENFYVIVGSAAGALIGLQFVVMTLIATRPMGAGRSEGADAFATPTIVHFGTVLLLSAVVGLLGIFYQVVVIRRMRKQGAYKPVLEDWLFHALLPLVAYGTFAVSAWFFVVHPVDAMFAVAAAALLLLFIGIHNAWDAVTYHIFVGKYERD